MVTKRIVFILALLIFTPFASPARALMTIYGYEAAKHKRFYGDWPDRAFIGEGYDWSGAGWSSDGDWATMISDQHFLTCHHDGNYPAPGATITFYENDTSTENPHYYTVDDWSHTWGDLHLGRLTEPLRAEDNITYYPILDLKDSGTYSKYFNLTFFAYGNFHRVGRNQIDETDQLGKTGIRSRKVGGVTTMSMQYNYKSPANDGLGADECRLESGDSGAPSFVALGDGRLALVGIHWYNDDINITNPDPDAGNYYSGDSFVPYYINGIKTYILDLQTFAPLGGDANLDGIVDEADATIMASNWLQIHAAWTRGDFNGDNTVNEIDATIMASNWHRSAGSELPESAATATPEPAVAVLLLSGSALLVALRRRNDILG